MSDYARGFRAGIAAAKTRIKAEASRLRSQGLVEVADRMVAEADHLRAIAPAAPKPSEAEVERVARAICSARGHNPDWEVVWGEKSCKWWEVFAKDARAALAAFGKEEE